MAQKVQKQVKAVTQWSINHSPYKRAGTILKKRCDNLQQLNRESDPTIKPNPPYGSLGMYVRVIPGA